jgi:hypothetical protein
MPSPKYNWDNRARQYRDAASGRFVPRDSIRGDAVDSYVDAARAEIKRISEQLRDRHITTAQWQLRMETIIKQTQTSATAIGSGGWKQASQSQWGYAGSQTRIQYGFLRDRAIQVESGLSLDDDFIRKAQDYATAATRTYEAVLRRADLDSGLVISEQRFTESNNPCKDCIRWAAMGKQKPGVLPDIGTKCKCESRCRCRFEREMRKPKQ